MSQRQAQRNVITRDTKILNKLAKADPVIVGSRLQFQSSSGVPVLSVQVPKPVDSIKLKLNDDSEFDTRLRILRSKYQQSLVKREQARIKHNLDVTRKMYRLRLQQKAAAQQQRQFAKKYEQAPVIQKTRFEWDKYSGQDQYKFNFFDYNSGTGFYTNLNPVDDYKTFPQAGSIKNTAYYSFNSIQSLARPRINRVPEFLHSTKFSQPDEEYMSRPRRPPPVYDNDPRTMQQRYNDAVHWEGSYGYSKRAVKSPYDYQASVMPRLGEFANDVYTASSPSPPPPNPKKPMRFFNKITGKLASFKVIRHKQNTLAPSAPYPVPPPNPPPNPRKPTGGSSDFNGRYIRNPGDPHAVRRVDYRYTPSQSYYTLPQILAMKSRRYKNRFLRRGRGRRYRGSFYNR